MSEQVAEQVAPAQAQQQAEQVDKPVGIMEHVASLKKAPEGKTEAATETATTTQQARDDKSGQFQPKHRAKKDEASPEDVPRIRELTREKRTAEERAERAERELAQLRAQGAPKREIAKAESRVDAAGGFSEPEPKEDDPKYAGDYGKYMRDVAGWEGRKAYHGAKQAERDAAEKTSRETEQREIMTKFGQRVDAAREKHDDFDAVALETPAPWATNSFLDAFITEDDNGPEILYYLLQSKNRQELDALLTKPVLAQAKHLALLSQRFAPESTEQTGSTEAVASRTIVLPPKPATSVRTEAQRTNGGPPPTDGSLSVLEHNKRFKRA